MAILLALAACKAHKGTAVQTAGESRSEVKYERFTDIDTVYITLPGREVERVVFDSVSIIQADSITSRAMLLPSGMLRHTLEVSAISMPVEVERITERTDSVAVRVETVTKYTERARRWWEVALLFVGGVSVIGCVVLVVRKLRQLVKNISIWH